MIEAKNRTPMRAPKKSAMPDLSGLFRKNILTLILSQVFTGSGPKELHPSIFLNVFVRVADKALEDYELARLAFLEFVNRSDNNVMSPLFRAIGHMENTLGSLERASKFVNRLLEDEKVSKEILEMDFMRRDSQKRLSKIRNATEHMDDRVIKGAVGEGDLNTLWLDEQHMELQDTKVEYSELAKWLSEIHLLASNLATYRPPSEKENAQQGTQVDA